MFNYLTKANHWLGQNMFFITITALLLGFNVQLPHFLLAHNVTVILFVYLTFITSLDIYFRDIVKIMRRPVLPLGMLMLIHGIIPFVAWIIGHAFFPNDLYVRIGLLISSAIPVGLTSIVWTGIAGGDVVLALVVVMLDTLLSPLILPVFFAIVLKQGIEINYVQMIGELILMVAVPSILAMAVNTLTKGRIEAFSHSIGGLTAKIGVFLIILINAAIIAPKVVWDFSMVKLLFVILLIMLSSYFLGFLSAFISRIKQRETIITMVFNTGMRNINFGFILALTYFPTAVAIPVTLASVFNQPLASLVSWIFNRKKEQAHDN